MTQKTIDKVNRVVDMMASGSTLKDAVKSIGWSINSYYAAVRKQGHKRKYTKRVDVVSKSDSIFHTILFSKYSDAKKIQALKALV